MARYRNRENQFKINNNVLAANMYNWSVSVSDETEEMDFYDGTSVKDTKKRTFTHSFQCQNDSADEAISYVRSKMHAIGDDLKISFTFTNAAGVAHTETNAYLQNIVPAGGNANDRDGLNFDVVYTILASDVAPTNQD